MCLTTLRKQMEKPAVEAGPRSSLKYYNDAPRLSSNTPSNAILAVGRPLAVLSLGTISCLLIFVIEKWAFPTESVSEAADFAEGKQDQARQRARYRTGDQVHCMESN